MTPVYLEPDFHWVDVKGKSSADKDMGRQLRDIWTIFLSHTLKNYKAWQKIRLSVEGPGEVVQPFKGISWKLNFGSIPGNQIKAHNH